MDLSSDKEPCADTRSRPLRDLRISVTDRCNFRCTYCMPKRLLLLPVVLRLTARWAWYLPRWAGRLLPDVRFGHA